MIRTRAQARAKLRACGRDDQERGVCAALGQRVHEIERGLIGPEQILEGEDDRLRPGTRQNPGLYRRPPPATQFFRRKPRLGVLG
jgi:hypothetical protein